MGDRIYSLETIKNILYSGISYELPESTREIINKLSNEFNTIVSKSYAPIKKNKNVKSLSSAKSVIISHSMQNTEKIRSYLNKISDKNYDTIKIQIIDFINEVPEQEIEVIINIFFDIATTNRFFTKLYASLYNEIYRLYPSIDTLLKIKITNFIHSLEKIESGEPEINYENFIRINEINEKRKVIASFFYYLMQENIISIEEIIKIIQHLLNLIWIYLQLDNKKKYIEEIIDIIDILFNKELLQLSTLYNETLIEEKNIEEVILYISKCIVRETPGLTNKAYFKVLDIIEKNNIGKNHNKIK